MVPESDANLSMGPTRSMAWNDDDTFEQFGSIPQQWVGKILGKYQVIKTIGQGGMGIVVEAIDPHIERNVAIKVLPERFAANSVLVNRFRAEARAAGRLSHPNVATIYEVGMEGATPYLVMELLSGGSIADELKKSGAQTPLEATRILIDSCRGISAAHRVGLVHRDVKPANLLRAADDRVKVTDFGLVKLSESDPLTAAHLTQSGTVIGTPYFMSPEQCQGLNVDARSDIYSLGATYYCLLTGKSPFQDSGGPVQVMLAHCTKTIPDPRVNDPSIPSACADIIARALAKAPADRYQSVEEMLADLQSVVAALSGEIRIDLPSQSGSSHAAVNPTPSPPRANLRAIVAGGAALLLVIAMIAMTVHHFAGDTSAGAVVPQGEPIKVGVLQSLSGTMSTSGTSVVDATLMAIEEINNTGGLLGRPIKPIVADGRSDTETYAMEAERLILEEKVCAVFGCWTSASRKTVRPIFEKHDNLLVYPVQYEGMETSPNIIYMGATPNQQIIPALNWAIEELGKKRFFIVGSDYVFPRAASEIIQDHVATVGANVVGEMFVPLSSPEFDPVVREIIKTKPDMILCAIAGDSNTDFFRALREADIRSADIPCLSFSMGEQELRSLSIENVEGDYAALTYFQSLDLPENNAFVERVTQRYPQRVVSDPMEATYVGVQLWAQAVREAQTIAPKKVIRAMLNERLAAPEGHIRIEPDTQHCFKTPRIGKIRNDGQFEVVWSAPEPMQPAPYPATRTAADWKAFLHDLYTSWGDQWAAPATD